MKASKFTLYLFFAVLVSSCESEAQQSNLSIAAFEKAIQQNNIQLLDVRTAGEYQSGHLKNALLADWNNKAEFQRRVSALDKNKPVYTYCLSGARSSAATQWLRENGYTAFNLTGGISAWKQANKPVEEAVAVKQISLQEYYAQIPGDKTVLVDFGAVWCPPCKKMAPLIDSLGRAYSTQLILLKIDGGDQTKICKELNIDAFPTFIIYKKGKEVWRKQGVVESSELVSKF